MTTVTVSFTVPAKLLEHAARLSRLAVFALATHLPATAVPHGWRGVAQGVGVGALEVVYRVWFPTQPEPKTLQAAAEAAKVPEAVVQEAVSVAVPAFGLTPGKPGT